jgi:hypothetical protein
MVVCAVRYEPVSGGNSLLTGKLTGNFVISDVSQAVSQREAAVPQGFFKQFPMKINRENISRNREFLAGNREFHL